MRNNIKFFLVFLFLFFNYKASSGAEFKFETSKIDYEDSQKIVKASEGVKILLEKQVTIDAVKFLYEKEKSTVLIEDNVVVNDPVNDLIIYAKEIVYNTSSEIIKSNLPSKVIYKNNYKFDLKSFVYDKKKLLVSSDNFSQMIDGLGNKISTEKFVFSIKENLIKAKNLKYKDNLNNDGKIENAMINVKDNSIFGNEFELNFDNSILGNESNEPRIKARTAIIEKGNTKLTKGTFTSCKRNNDKCPPWLINSEEVLHDKKKKTIYYKNAWLKVYDMPVLYFPKFFHPDPTVKRRSGFLVPSFSDSKSLGGAIKVPYYSVVAENKDFTVSPTIYFDKKAIIQTEYRQKNKSDEHIVDFSVLSNMQGESRSKTHFFSNSNFNLGLSAFDSSHLKINIQQVSNDTYLKTYNVISPIINNNVSTLESSIEIYAYKDDLELELSTEMLEDLSKAKSDRYEYILPNFSLRKDLDLYSKIDGSLTFMSSGHRKLYDTNIYEDILINDLLYTSNPKISKKGIMSDYKILLKNLNSDSKNSSNYKSNFDTNVMTQLSFNNRFPLFKENKGQKNYFTPILSLRYSPNKTRNLINEDRRIEYNNIFSFNRLGSENTVEGGESATLGIEYKKINNQNNEFLKFNIASLFRNKEDPDIPLNSTLGRKNSDLFSNLFYKPNDIFNLDYNFTIDNNLDTINYHHVKTGISINNFVTDFEFLERSDEAVNESFFKNSLGYEFDESNSLKYETRKNKLTDSTEYYSLIYEYKNDCLTAAIEYNKNYYTDGDLKPSEDVFFKLTVIPFGEGRSPNLNK